MAWSFFTKHVSDTQICLVRDIIQVGDSISSISSEAWMISIIRKTINDHKLTNKLQEFSELPANHEIDDCYPYNEQEKTKYANTLFSMISLTEIDEEKIAMMSKATFILKDKMNFDKEDIQALIMTHYIPSCADDFKDGGKAMAEYLAGLYFKI